MLITKKLGHIRSFDTGSRNVDWLDLAWYEMSRRIGRKKTRAGRELSWKFLNENPAWAAGDILFHDEEKLVAVAIIPCDVIVIRPRSPLELASACYEIGNKHLPLFFENDELLAPFEQPLFRLLSASGYDVKKEERQLQNALRTTVAPHGNGGSSLFSKIMQLTNAGT